MNSYTLTQQWIEEIKDIKIPQLDINGLTRIVVGEELLVNIFANPNASQDAENSVFFYTPLMNIHLTSEQEQVTLLWYVAEQNMAARLPMDMTLSASKESQYIWLNMHLSTAELQKNEFQNALILFIEQAQEQKNNLETLDLSNVNTSNIDSSEMSSNSPENAANIIWG